MPTRREALIAGLSAATVGYVGAVMSDRPDFQRSQDIADQSLPEQETAVTTQRSVEVVVLNEVRTGILSANEGESVTLGPPAGSILRVNAIQFSAAGSGGAGSHSVEVSPFGGVAGTAIEAEFGGKDTISIDGGVIENQSAAVFKSPKTQAAQVASVRSLVADSNNPVEFLYTNTTDQAQTGGRTYGVVAEQIQVE